MRRLFVAPRAVLLPLGPLGMLPPVLGREIVPALTGGAFHCDVLPRHLCVFRLPSSVISACPSCYGPRITDDGGRLTSRSSSPLPQPPSGRPRRSPTAAPS